jgi:uncharacterized damage-inducible protein DinB
MKELLKQYAAYNLWATQQILDTVSLLPEEKIKEKLPSSFNSLFETVLHMFDAESIWWQRMKLNEKIVRPSENYMGSFEDLSISLQNQSRLWVDWVTAASELSIEHVFQYYTNKKELVKLPVYQVMHHVFNHGTYHRGQLVNMLRQLGVEKIPSTDFSFWVLKKMVAGTH